MDKRTENEIARLYSDLRAIERQVISLQRGAGAGGGWRAVSASHLGNTIPSIVDQTGAAGTSTSLRRTDCVPKLPLAGTPADTGTAGNATLEFCSGGGGLQARLTAYASLPANKSHLERGTGGLLVPFKASSGLAASADGLTCVADPPITLGASGIGISLGNGVENSGGSLAAKVVAPISLGAAGIGLNIGNGLELSGSDLQVKLNGTSLTLGASGLAANLADDAPGNLNTSGSSGSSSQVAREDHYHGCAITGETSWQTVGHANAGKIYAVYKADPV